MICSEATHAAAVAGPCGAPPALVTGDDVTAYRTSLTAYLIARAANM